MVATSVRLIRAGMNTAARLLDLKPPAQGTETFALGPDASGPTESTKEPKARSACNGKLGLDTVRG